MELTPQQEAIASYQHGPLIVVAGAGSGKTTVICSRYARMIMSHQCLPGEHLMLTFSRKAANEMRLRCLKFLEQAGYPANPQELAIDTYHAFGYRIIRDHPHIAHRKDGVTLQNDTDRKRAIKAIYKKLGHDLDVNRKAPSIWYEVYSLAKNYGQSAALKNCHASLLSIFEKNPTLSKVDPQDVLQFAIEYERQLKLTNTLDFDDLCLWPARGLHQNPDVAKELAHQYPFITIDEAQDTNLTQFEMVSAIAKHHKNIVMVGDDDQAIYGWRGARVENMRKFVRTYKAKIAKLEQNFRSTPAIVDCATEHIKHNTERMDKTPFAAGERGHVPVYSDHETGYDMADTIAQQVANEIAQGVPPNEIAILYRTNRMARVIEGSLRALGLGYNIVGGRSLYDSPEVKATIAGARLLINPRDIEALRSLHYYIPGMGKKAFEEIQSILEEDPFIDVYEAFDNASTTRLRKLGGWLKEKLEYLMDVGPERAGRWLLEDEGIGYQSKLEAMLDKRPDDIDTQNKVERKIANLEALDVATAAAARFYGEPDLLRGESKEEFLQKYFQVLLEAQLSQPDPDDTSEESQKKAGVVLSTAHRAKGLEWHTVHIAGFSEGLMPLEARDGNNFDDDDAQGYQNKKKHLSEERRLSYVALTRAKKHCVLHHAHELRFPGDSETTVYTPSSFLDEMGPQVQAQLNQHGAQDDYNQADDLGNLSHATGYFSELGL